MDKQRSQAVMGLMGKDGGQDGGKGRTYVRQSLTGVTHGA